MKLKEATSRFFAVLVILCLVLPPGAFAQDQSGGGFNQPQLDQLLAPLALYPDDLLTQVLMASTYPLEVVQAARWAEQNKDLKGDVLTAALEKQDWDPSVKSLVNFPQVLQMMNDKLDWTEQLGDAFIGQQKDVLDTVQKLRVKAQAEGNLNSSREQSVVVEKETQTIIIQPADPQVVYVPTYDPTVVYGAWPYPAYPPYPIYPPGYYAGRAAFSFGAGVAVGAAWGYAWGSANWRGGSVNYNYRQNTNINNNINRNNYQSGNGNWQHNSEHRKGVSYRDQATAQKYNRGGSSEAAKSREAYRGRAEAGRQGLSRGGAEQFRGGSQGRTGTSQRGGAFEGAGRGSDARSASGRGRASRESMSSRGGGGGSRGGGGSSGGGNRGGGGRGGGGRGGGGRR